LRESLRCKGLGRLEEAFQPQGPVLLRPQCIELFLFQDDVLARTAGDAADDGRRVDRPVHGAVLDEAEALATIRPAPLAVQLLPELPERGSLSVPLSRSEGTVVRFWNVSWPAFPKKTIQLTADRAKVVFTERPPDMVTASQSPELETETRWLRSSL
jgi:hypothetical protein